MKKKNSELFPLRDSESQLFQRCGPVIKKKHQSIDNMYCLPNYQISPVFLNYLEQGWATPKIIFVFANMQKRRRVYIPV